MTSGVRLLRTFATKLAAYAVTFSPDGRILAWGDGFWYGMGHVGLVAPEGGAPVEVPFRGDLGADGWPAVSGLAFDASGTFLAFSAWSSGHAYAPCGMARVAGGALRPLLTAWDPPELRRAPRTTDAFAATGVLLDGGKLVVRRSTEDPGRAVTSHPAGEDVRTDGLRPHLTSSRIVSLGRGWAATGAGAGLLVAPVDAVRAAEARRLAAPHDGALTAITRGPAGTVVTGGRDGTVAWWRVGGVEDEADGAAPPEAYAPELVQQAVVGPGDGAQGTPPPQGLYVHYRPESVVAACFMGEGERLVTADAAGLVRLWADGEPGVGWRVPAGSPRSLAAHPGRPWVAVACKGSGGGPGPGQVHLFEVEVGS